MSVRISKLDVLTHFDSSQQKVGHVRNDSWVHLVMSNICRLVVIVNCQIPSGKTIHVVGCTEVSETMASKLSVTAQALFQIESRDPQRYLNSFLPGVIQSIKCSVKVHAFFLRLPAARNIFIYKIERKK